ncbi:hypothetical protein Tco_1250570, partial [Tanacetum coccineum]
MTILASLDSPVNDEDVVHYALAGLPDKYDQVCGYMHYKDTFPDLKMARSLLVTEEMRLKSKALALPADSSSPMVLMADLGNNNNGSNTQGRGTVDASHTTNELLTKLLQQLGSMDVNSTAPSPTNNPPVVAFHTGIGTSSLVGATGLAAPPGFHYGLNYLSPAQQQVTTPHAGPLPAPAVQPNGLHTRSTSQPGTIGSAPVSGQATTLSHAFT